MREERLVKDKERAAAFRHKEEKNGQGHERTRCWAEGRDSDTDKPSFDPDHVPDKKAEDAAGPEPCPDLRMRESRDASLRPWRDCGKTKSEQLPIVKATGALRSSSTTPDLLLSAQFRLPSKRGR